MGSNDNIRVLKGSIFVYRVFDIAEEVNLHTVEDILSQKSGDARLRLTRKTRGVIVVRNAPVRVSLGEQIFSIIGRNFKADTIATIWDYGAISIAFQIAIEENTPFSDLVAISVELTRMTEEVEAIAKSKAVEVTAVLKSALKSPADPNLSEDYLTFFLEKISGIERAEDLLKGEELSRLILSDSQEPLASATRERSTEDYYQYADNDIAVIGWNAAFVLEPSGERDIPDVLEFALTQLLELQYYDELLDTRLSELYDAIEVGKHRLWQSPFASVSKEANTRFLEFSEITERISNSLKVVGDFYLARIFRGALRRFRVYDWQESITRKMNLLARTSELLQGQTNTRRGHLLELTVILLILFEIISTIWR